MLTVKNTWKEIAEAGVDTAILPIGSIEQHGPHLPLATDFLLADTFARKLAEHMGNVLLLPTVPYGCSVEHMAFPGTVTLRAATLAAIITDIVESLRRHGLKYVIVKSWHGGNFIVKPTLREINYSQDDILCIWAGGPIPDEGEEVPQDIHAGMGETSGMLEFFPELVGDYQSQPDTPGTVGQEFLDYLGFDKTTKSGVWGRPANATAESGRDGIARGVEHTARYVEWVKKHFDKLRKEDGAAKR